MEAATAGAGPASTIALRIQLIDSLRRNGNGFGPTTISVDLTQLFTRKLVMIWEATCFVAFPGGFGTLDEIFELLTMMQTQLAPPRPILLIERPGDTFWSGLDRHLWQKLTRLRLIDPDDRRYLIRATPDDPVIDRVIEAGRSAKPAVSVADGEL
jgi:predicted Rossmann-fold nucleotide-binding protein